MYEAHNKAIELLKSCRELGAEGRSQERLVLALSIAEFHPNCIDVQEELGYDYWSCGRKEEGVHALRRSIQLGNDRSCPLIIFGHWLAELGYFDELESHLRECWRRYPDELHYPRELGYGLMRYGATDRGAAVFREFLELHPADFRGVSMFITMLACAGQWEDAFEVLDRYGRNAMTADKYHSERGTLFAEMGQRSSAEHEWRLGLELEGKTEDEVAENLAELREYWFEGGMQREEAEFAAANSSEEE